MEGAGDARGGHTAFSSITPPEAGAAPRFSMPSDIVVSGT